MTIKQIPAGSFFYFQPAAIHAEENIVTNRLNGIRGTELYQLTVCLWFQQTPVYSNLTKCPEFSPDISLNPNYFIYFVNALRHQKN